MRRDVIYIAAMLAAVLAPCVYAAGARIDLTEEMKDSIVFLETAAYGYDLSDAGPGLAFKVDAAGVSLQIRTSYEF